MKCEGYILSDRLHDDYSQGFSNTAKDEIVESAAIALKRYKAQAILWFNEISAMSDITERYFESTHLNKSNLGGHGYGLQLGAANYGLLLRLAARTEESLNLE